MRHNEKLWLGLEMPVTGMEDGVNENWPSRGKQKEVSPCINVNLLIVPFPGAVTKMPSFPPSHNEVQCEIMAWLRNASDRNGGRRQRELAKQREAEGRQADMTDSG
jgi:hypothetical protein